MSDVSRRASQLWKSRSSRPGIDSTHPHQVLEDVEESIPMDETGPPSASSPPDTPRTSVADTPRSSSTDPFQGSTENPFENPQYVEVRQESSSTLTTASESAFPPTPKDVIKRPVGVEETSPRKVGPPQPLGLPIPANLPPPPRETVPQRQALERGVEGTGKRWWTEWLCGCREDEADQVCDYLNMPDDVVERLVLQAGRTNPME